MAGPFQDGMQQPAPGQTIGTMTAYVERVDLVGGTSEQAGAVTKGMSFLTSRIPVLGTGQHAVYTIVINVDGKTSRVQKRFSEFDTLHAFLKTRWPYGLTFDLPSKTAVRKFSETALEDRKCQLNAYIRELCKQHEMINCPQVQIFFGIHSGITRDGYDNSGIPSVDNFLGGPESGFPQLGQQTTYTQGQPNVVGAPRQRLDPTSGNPLGGAPTAQPWNAQPQQQQPPSYQQTYSQQSYPQQPYPGGGYGGQQRPADPLVSSAAASNFPAYNAPAGQGPLGAAAAPAYEPYQPKKPLPRKDSSDDDLAGWAR